MADLITKVVFRSEQRPRHGIKIIQIKTSLFFSETKSIVRVHCTRKWNLHYKAYPAGDHYINPYFLIYHFRKTLNAKNFRLQTGYYLLNCNKHCIGLHRNGLRKTSNVPETVN